jgi:hypothetical protein
MAIARQVTCITRRGGQLDPRFRISRIGGLGWWLAEEDAIAELSANMNAFYVETPTGTAYLAVALYHGRQYLSSEADGAEPTDLLALPECP